MPSSTADRIERAAARLFATRGFAATSIREIAAAVGIKPPSLYAHFAAKDDILASIILGSYDRYLRDLRERLDGARSPRRRLDVITATTVQHAIRERDATYAGLHEVRMLRPESAAAVAISHGEFVELVRSVVADGVAAGEFLARQDVELLAAAVRSLGAEVARRLVESPELPSATLQEDFQAFARRLVGAAPRR